jgi:CheY-like chemotaxis protein
MKKLLVVEDYEPTRKLLGHVFKQGFSVVFAIDGVQAVEVADSERPDLILMDISLPRQDGLHAARSIRSLPHLASVPIFAISAHDSTSGFAMGAREAGCEAYFMKPFSPRDLRAAVEQRLAT